MLPSSLSHDLFTKTKYLLLLATMTFLCVDFLCAFSDQPILSETNQV